MRRCVALASRRGSVRNGISEFEDDSVRDELEAILREQPDLFYAEALLGTWYRIHGDPRHASEFQERSYRHAPVVLVQQFRLPDGSPAPAVQVERVEVECNRVMKHSLDPSLKLLYVDLVTDDTGAIYCPAYDTVYRLFSVTWPRGYRLDVPSEGWVISRHKVGVLRPATLRRLSARPEGSL